MAALFEVLDVVRIEAFQDAADLCIKPVLLHEETIALGSYGKAVRHLNFLAGAFRGGREILMHLAQVRILAAHDAHIMPADLIEPKNKSLAARTVIFFHYSP